MLLFLQLRDFTFCIHFFNSTKKLFIIWLLHWANITLGRFRVLTYSRPSVFLSFEYLSKWVDNFYAVQKCLVQVIWDSKTVKCLDVQSFQFMSFLKCIMSGMSKLHKAILSVVVRP